MSANTFSHRLKAIARWLLPPVMALAANKVNRYLRRRRTFAKRVVKYGDFFLQCDASHHLPEILASCPDFGRNLADIVAALKVQEPRVIDVGANIGDTALLLARFAPGTRVLCVEGDPLFMPDLKHNTRQIPGVTIAEATLSDQTSQLRGTFVGTSGTAHLVLSETGDLIQTKTLDDLLASYPEFSDPHVIKIDTDGFEPAILRGAKCVLTSSRPVVFYEWHPYSYNIAGENDVSHAEFLMNLGYDWFLMFTNIGQLLLRVRRPGRDVLESLANFSRARRSVDDWHYDVAAFPHERQDVWEHLWQQYSK